LKERSKIESEREREITDTRVVNRFMYTYK
jgi:hypothetical protein